MYTHILLCKLHKSLLCAYRNSAKGQKTVGKVLKVGREVYSFMSKIATIWDDYINETITQKQMVSKVAALVGSLGGRVIGRAVGSAMVGPFGGALGAELGDWIGGAVTEAVVTILMDLWTDELELITCTNDCISSTR